MRLNLQFVRRLRVLQGMTQEDLADAVDVSVYTVHKWETGKSFPSPRHLGKLAKVLGAKKPGDLLADTSGGHRG